MKELFEKLYNETANKYKNELDELYKTFDCDITKQVVDEETCKLMFDKLQDGEFFDIFSKHSSLKDLPDDKRKEIFDLVVKHLNISFPENDVEEWMNGYRNYILPKKSSTKKLEEIDLLLKITSKGGEKSLEFLEEIDKHLDYDDPGFEVIKESFEANPLLSTHKEYSNTEVTDQVLLAIILQMIKEDSPYNVFDTYQKAQLLVNPLGTLYFHNEETIKFTNPILLSMEINNRMGPKHPDFPRNDNMLFYQTVTDMSEAYKKSITRYFNINMKKSMLDFIDDVNNKYYKDYWDINFSPLNGTVDTPFNPDATENKSLK